jgi:hypothetical protein
MAGRRKNSRGIFGMHGSLGLPLGAVGDPIPSVCSPWTTPFKNCVNTALQEAQNAGYYYCRDNIDTSKCPGAGTDAGFNDFVNQYENMLVWQNCIPSYCPQGDPSVAKLVSYTPYKSGDPCISSNTIKNVQWQVGTDTDGKWGPLSQAALNATYSAHGTTFCDIVPGCTGPMPTGVTCPKPPTPPAAAPPAAAPKPVIPQPVVVKPPAVFPQPQPYVPPKKQSLLASMGAGTWVTVIALTGWIVYRKATGQPISYTG